MKNDPDFSEVKVKRGRGRPRKLDKKLPKTIGRVNRAPKVRSAEEEMERETDRMSGYRSVFLKYMDRNYLFLNSNPNTLNSLKFHYLCK